MPRYVAFLRGVSPSNAKMPELTRAFESAGFTDVRTVLSSGNVVFTTAARSETSIARAAETAMSKHLRHTFPAIVRSTAALSSLIEADPYATVRIPANAKRVVTFLGGPLGTALALPIERDGVEMLSTNGREVFTVYVPGPRGPVFMTLIAKTLGTNVTTRTWDTVRKCAKA